MEITKFIFILVRELGDEWGGEGMDNSGSNEIIPISAFSGL